MPLPNQLLTLAEKSTRDSNTGLTNIEETIVHYIDSSGWKAEYDEINKCVNCRILYCGKEIVAW